MVQLKPHEFGEVLSKLEQLFPSQNLFWKVKFAIKSIYLAGDIEGFFLSWLYKCCDALYAWTTKETWLVIIYLLLTRSWIPMQKAQCDPYAHPGVYSPSNSNIYINWNIRWNIQRNGLCINQICHFNAHGNKRKNQ